MTFIESSKILLRKLKPGRYGFGGDYPSWENAKKQCSGYDSNTILEKVKNSTLKVKRGEFPFERDGVLFDNVEYSWPLLNALMWVAAINKSRLNVLDFGGSLGSSYFQNKYFLDTLEHVNWSIVEQENFIECGKTNIEDANLRFFYSATDAIHAQGLPDVLVLACTLPYISDPYRLLEDLVKLRIPYLIIDNTFFNYEDRDRVCIQKVPPGIYEASYPCWFLSYQDVKKKVGEQYSIISCHKNESSILLDGRRIQYQGFLAKINTV